MVEIRYSILLEIHEREIPQVLKYWNNTTVFSTRLCLMDLVAILFSVFGLTNNS